MSAENPIRETSRILQDLINQRPAVGITRRSGNELVVSEQDPTNYHVLRSYSLELVRHLGRDDEAQSFDVVISSPSHNENGFEYNHIVVRKDPDGNIIAIPDESNEEDFDIQQALDISIHGLKLFTTYKLLLYLVNDFIEAHGDEPVVQDALSGIQLHLSGFNNWVYDDLGDEETFDRQYFTIVGKNDEYDAFKSLEQLGISSTFTDPMPSQDYLAITRIMGTDPHLIQIQRP